MFQSMCAFLYLRVGMALQALTVQIHERSRRDERGQASAEYALVLMAAAGLAILFGTWAVKSGNISKIFENVLDTILGDMKQ